MSDSTIAKLPRQPSSPTDNDLTGKLPNGRWRSSDPSCGRTPAGRAPLRGFTFCGVRIGLLGPLEIVTADGPVAFGAPKERALLTLLALRVGRPVSTTEVIDALWGESPPRTARKAVQTYVGSLRRHLPPGAISTNAGDYCLNGADVDVQRFEGLLRKGRRLSTAGEHAAAAAALTEALGLWRGPPLPDLVDQERGSVEAVRLVELHDLAEEDLADLWLARGDHDAVIPALETAVGREPLRERRWAQLMVALYRAGRQSDALRAYQRIRRLLGEELGVSPGEALVLLEQAILAQDPKLRPVPPDPGADERRRRWAAAVGGSRLPVAANTFIGRQIECDSIAALLDRGRLVSVVGSGGCGKTRLAIEVANQIGDHFADGVALARLASADDQSVVAQVAAAFDVAAEPDRPLLETVVAALAGRHVLIVLDNCEHVIAAAADTAEVLVSSCTQVSILATTREALLCPSEHRFSLGPLHKPSAVDLFVARATAARGRPVDETEMASVDEICRRLDGLPLAIEIAAARGRFLGLAELAANLKDHRLALTGLRTSENRHQTLRAAIDWSYRLLSGPQQRLFRRLSVFAGGAGYEEAQAFSTPLDVADLIDKSLLVRSVGTDDGPTQGRLAMHETVRQFAADLLSTADEAAAAGRDHAGIYLDMAETAGRDLRNAGQVEAIARLAADNDNLAAAISWALHHGDAELSARFGRALWWYWFRSGQPGQGRAWIEAAIASGLSDPHDEGRAAAGYLAWDTDDFDVATGHAAAVLDHRTSSLPARALALGTLARVYGDRCQFDAAAAAARESETLYQHHGDPWLVAWARRCRASVALYGGDPESARALTVDAMSGFEAVGDDWAIVGCIELLAGIAMRNGDTDGALTLAGRSVTGHRRFKDWSGTRVALLHLASVARQANEADLARQAAAESLALSEDHGYRLGALHAHLLLGRLAADAGHRSTVEFHARSAAGLARRSDDPLAGIEDHQAAIEAGELLALAGRLDEGG
jgi:predicted ATPase/DNA-binding SARP family transcriptional activator